MQFRILGPLEVWADGRPVALVGAKQRALLAILVLQANRVVASERLIQLLWGGDARETADHTLQEHVSQLRKALEPNHRAGTAYRIVATQAPGYQLLIQPEDTDLGQFKRRVGEARLARSQGDWPLTAKRLGEALRLWRGPALANVSGEHFVVGERAQLEEIHLQALEDRIEAEMMLGPDADLISELEALVAEHPFRERFTAHLMVALYRAGRQAEATEVFMQTRKKLAEDFGMEPGPELQDLFKKVLKQDPVLLQSTPSRPSIPLRKHNVPIPLTAIIARDEAVERLSNLLSQSRLVTLTGVGGIGKSRLALEVANESIPSFGDGVWFVELNGVRDAKVIEATVRAAMGLAEQPVRAETETIRDFLENRQSLLVLDNCEHLTASVAVLVATLLQGCSGLRVMATSRELLGVPGERAWPVTPLDVPSNSVPTTAFTDYGAIDLFCERASTALDEFSPSGDELQLIAEICRRLDGIPLAIELAAARTRTLSIHQIESRIDDRFALLTSRQRTDPAHHQTLKAAIDWSYRMLPPLEQVMFRRFAVFVARAPLQAVESVCEGGQVIHSEVANLVSALAEKSLLMVDKSSGNPHYYSLESIRAFGLDLLTQSGELTEIRDRHLDWYVALAEQAESGLRGKSQAGWLGKVEISLDDLRSALGWAQFTNAAAFVRLARGLAGFWLRWGYVKEGRLWLQAAISRPTEVSKVRGECLICAGVFALQEGDDAAAIELLEQGLAVSLKVDDQASRGWAMVKLGTVAIDEGHVDRGLDLMSDGVEVCRQAGDVWGLASGLNNLGLSEHQVGLPAKASLRHLEESLELSRSIGDDLLRAGIADSVAQVATAKGDLGRARALWGEVLEASLRLHETIILPFCLEGFGRLATLEGRPAEGLSLFAAAQSARAQTGVILARPEQIELDHFVDEARRSLEEQSASKAWEAGLRMPMDEMIKRALEPVRSIASYSIEPPPASEPGRVTQDLANS